MERTEWQDPPDPDAATIADEAPGEDLRAYVHAWRAGSDLMAAELARNAQFSLKRPVQTLSAACEALCRHACRRQPALLQLPSDTLRGRGLMLVRQPRSSALHHRDAT